MRQVPVAAAPTTASRPFVHLRQVACNEKTVSDRLAVNEPAVHAVEIGLCGPKVERQQMQRTKTTGRR